MIIKFATNEYKKNINDKIVYNKNKNIIIDNIEKIKHEIKNFPKDNNSLQKLTDQIDHNFIPYIINQENNNYFIEKNTKLKLLTITNRNNKIETFLIGNIIYVMNDDGKTLYII